MIVAEEFLPQTLNQWLTALGILFLWTFTAWRMYLKLVNDVNNVGARVNVIEVDRGKVDTEIVNLKLEQQRSADDRGTMRERIAASESKISNLTEELREERLAIMSTLHASEKAAAERDATMRVEIARITERLDIEQMIKSVVRNFKAN